MIEAMTGSGREFWMTDGKIGMNHEQPTIALEDRARDIVIDGGNSVVEDKGH
jgi:hypothetical protein